MKFAVLMTCHNRVGTTLECLAYLSAAAKGYDCDVYLNDDGSTDGTGARVAAAYPNVKIIQGSGRDYWCGGMRRAWQSAIDSGKDYDGYLWLNDDTFLFPDGLRTLLSAPDAGRVICVGAICSRDGRTATYGGENAHGFLPPDGRWQALRQMNGNVVWVSRAAFARLGNLDRHWTHAMGDVDYSRTAVERGIPVLLSPKFVGTCDKDDRLAPWRDPCVPLLARLKNLYSPLGYGEPHNMFRYCLKHDGLGKAVKIWLSCHWTAFFPRKGASCAF